MPPLSTRIVGSCVKPAWLVRHGHEHHPDGSWRRPGPEVLAAAQDDATLLAIREQERAGLDVVTDGEIRRQRHNGSSPRASPACRWSGWRPPPSPPS